LRDPVIGFVSRFVLIFGLLIAPWPGWNGLYGQYFREFGQMVFDRDEGKCMVHFVPNEGQAGLASLDTEMTLANRDLIDDQGKGLVKRSELDTRSIGWVPTALTMGLILATPIPWGRRILALLGGLILIHGFIIFSLQSCIWSNSPELSLMTLPPFWKEVADELDYTLMNQLGASFSVPVLIWILVAFCRKDALVGKYSKA
jgi:hypothetical protein